MQIADYLGQYANSLASGAATSQAKTTGSTVQNLVSSLSEFQEGTVFEGSINSIDGSKIILGLGNGQTIPARLDGSVNLMLGQSVFFQVKSNDGNTIAIKPYTGGAAFNPTIQKALDAAGMEMTKDTIDMVNRMMEEGMPIDKHALTAMRHSLMQNPSVSMSTAIAMTKLGLPVNEQLAAQFENYSNDRHMMLNQMEQVMDELPGAYAKVPASEIMQFNRQVLTILGDGQPQDNAPGPVFTSAQPDGTQQAEGQAVPGQPDQSGTQGLQDASANTARTLVENPEEAVQKNQERPAGQLPPAEPEAVPAQNDRPAVIREDLPRQTGELLNRHQLAALEAQLKEVFPQAKDLKLNTQLNARELLDAIAKQLQETPEADKGAVAKLFSGKEYQALLKDVIEKQWTVKPQELKEPHKVEELYQRLDRQMAQIEQLAKHTGMNTGQLSQSAQQVRNNIDFMNQINQAYTYVQIPLKMANQNAHSELYVYTNKRNLRRQEGELSAFLHLDLEHLGSTDVSVKMLDKNVTTRFYLSDDASYDLVEAHLPRLQERLKKLGYNCTVTVENREEKVDFVEDFLQKGQPAKAASRGMVHRYSFDVRA